MAYHSNYSGAEVDALLDKIKNDDVGSIDSSLSTTSENPVKNKVITEELNKKVDKVEGKQLSTEDFTSELKGKLDGLSNYDDTNLKGDLEVLKGKVDEKQDYIADLDSIRSGASKGSTAIQEHQDISHLLPKSDFDTYATKTDTKLTELESQVFELGITFEAGGINYLNGKLVTNGKSIRTADIPIIKDVRIIGSFPRTLYYCYIVKYLNGVYAGYEDISVSGTNINQLLQKDATFDSFRLRVDVIYNGADWTIQEISGSSAKIYLLDSVAEKLYTLSDSVEDIEGKITSSPSSLENILTMQGVLQLLQRMKKTYFAYSSKGYANLNGLSVGSTFVFSPIGVVNYTYDYISVEEGDVIILTTMGTTPSAKSYAIMDADNKVLAIQQNAVTNALLIMPTGAKSFVANTETSTSGYSFVHIMGKTADYNSAVEIIKSLVRREYIFLPLGQPMSLENGPIPAGSTIMEVKGSDAVTNINLYDANGENRINIPIASLPYTTTMDYYMGSTVIAGNPLLTIVTRGIEDIIDALQKPIDSIMAKEYEIANHDNDFSFDNLFVGQLVTALHQLQRNYEVPTDGAYISTDVEYTSVLSEPVSDEQMFKSFVPYLYINGEKRGTIVLFDADGTPFIYDKNGTKKYLTLS